MSTSLLSEMPIAASRETFPRILHYSPVQVLAVEGSEDENSVPIGSGVSFNLSRNGMKLFTTLPIDPPHFKIRFLTPAGADVTRAVRVVNVEHRIEWVWLHELEFESLLPESAM